MKKPILLVLGPAAQCILKLQILPRLKHRDDIFVKLWESGEVALTTRKMLSTKLQKKPRFQSKRAWIALQEKGANDINKLT